jgi:hypothetical protein
MFGTEASRERWSVRFALAALVISLGAVMVTYLQLRSSDRAVTVAEQSRDDAVKQLEVSERPWLEPELTVTEPLEFTRDGGVTLKVTEKVTNIGHSIAVNVSNPFAIHLRYPLVSWENARAEQKKLCGDAREHPETNPIGDNLFPQESESIELSATFTKEQVQAARLMNENAIIGFTVLGCADYVSSFSPSHHQTGYVYDISKVHLPGVSNGIGIGESVPAEKFVVHRNLVGLRSGGFYAD